MVNTTLQETIVKCAIFKALGSKFQFPTSQLLGFATQIGMQQAAGSFLMGTGLDGQPVPILQGSVIDPNQPQAQVTNSQGQVSNAPIHQGRPEANTKSLRNEIRANDKRHRYEMNQLRTQVSEIHSALKALAPPSPKVKKKATK